MKTGFAARAFVRFAAIAAFFAASAQAHAATVTTDKGDYVPGEIVNIGGSGWAPNEGIDLLLEEDPNVCDDRTFHVVADAQGNIPEQPLFTVEEHDRGLWFRLSASGPESGGTEVIFADNGQPMASCPSFSHGDQFVPDKLCGDGSDCVWGCNRQGAAPGTNCLGADNNPFLVFAPASTACSDDGQACTSDVCDGSGTCTHPAVTDGTSCDDGNACTQTDTCQSGVCVGSNPVICTASDQCHVAGTCDTTTGVCSNPNAQDGTGCNDGDACTQTDTCQSGVCVGSNPVVCTASDQCHVAGTCNSATGVCSNPNAQDGTGCNDGNACTQTDTCQSGTCVGSNPVICTASDQCHVAGTCNSATGVCSNPNAPNGTSCNDGNACTQTDTCQSGVCTGSNPVVCTAADKCHVAGTCNSTTGVCSNPASPAGTSCDDNTVCNGHETCDGSGTCQAGTPLVVDDGNPCTIDSCDPVTGVKHSNAAAGTSCDDNTVCNGHETCDGSGTCQAGTPLDCNDHTECTVDTCDPTKGCQHALGACSLVTDSELCQFDVDTSVSGNQFRLLLTPDQNNQTVWKLNASNPGQFYYNVVYKPADPTKASIVKLFVPYPFVTKGAVPIHVYSDVHAFLDANGDNCFAPSPNNEIANSSHQVTLGNGYDAFGKTQEVDVAVPALPGTVAYINIHLDYGLKGETGCSKTGVNNATCTTPTGVTIVDPTSYDFDDSTGTGGDTIYSENSFKRDPGIGGLVTSSVTSDPVANVKIQIYDSSNKLLATVYTDQDGWYMWQYKYTGKAATFTVKLPAYGKSSSVTLKSNGFLVVSFTVP